MKHTTTIIGTKYSYVFYYLKWQCILGYIKVEEVTREYLESDEEWKEWLSWKTPYKLSR